MNASGVGHSRPLCVDLDGTLLRSDLLYETFLRMLARHPWLLFVLPFWLLRGKAHLKHQLAVHGAGDPALLPYDPRVVELLKASSDRRRVLCTASDATLVEPIARHLGVFDDVFCSDGHTNLAGHRKADLLVKRFGERGVRLHRQRPGRPGDLETRALGLGGQCGSGAGTCSGQLLGTGHALASRRGWPTGLAQGNARPSVAEEPVGVRAIACQPSFP